MSTSSPHQTRSTSSRWGRPTMVAAEHHAGYDTTGGEVAGGAGPADTGDGEDDGQDAGQGPPLGFHVLAEIPELAEALEGLVAADRHQLAAVAGLARIIDTDEIQHTTGTSLEHWLGAAAAATRMDRRLLARTARLLVRLPGLRGLVEAQQISFAQLRGLTLALKGLPRELDDTVDGWLTDAGQRFAAWPTTDPDALVEQARAAVAELTDQAQVEQDDATAGRSLVLQPRLDGAGGRFFGEEDAYGLAMLDAATAPRPGQLAAGADAGRARADNLQTLLHHVCDHDPAPAGRDGDGHDDAHGEATGPDRPGGDHAPGDRGDPTDGAGTPTGDTTELARPARLPGSVAARIAAGKRPAAPKLLVRIDLATLLGRGDIPGEVLTRLAGGKLALTSTAARHVVAHAGAQVRAIVVDDGEVVGVGRATRVPPGWLADAVHALHDCCTGPLCDRPALSADLDHAAAWNPWDPDATGHGPDSTGPHGPYRRGGNTDLDNIGPLCAGTNRNRAKTGWSPTQTKRGVRTWHHERSGLAITSVPTTWRPPGHRTRSPDTRGDPPGPRDGPADTRGDPPDGDAPANGLRDLFDELRGPRPRRDDPDDEPPPF